MPIRRTRMIGGERYTKTHHDGNAEIKEIMDELNANGRKIKLEEKN